MPLFQNSVLNKYLKEQDKTAVQSAYDMYRSYFHNPDIQRNILEAKEEQFQEGFLRELFVKVFGYVLNPRPDYNLTTEYKNEKGAKKADGAILRDEKAVAVIELKSTKTKDLESIRQQAFDYKANQTGCVYVITSNFQKLRFYINDAVEFEEFDLFILSQERFEVLYLCLTSENILSDIPLKIKNASILEEEQITKKFYADYSSFKKDLFESMVDLNMGIEGVSKILLYKKTQKLLDRFLFIFFAEDRGLLPPNSISRMIERWTALEELDAYKPLYEIFKQYFGYLNKGRKGKVPADDIHEYNGGLFLPDELLDKIEIDDDVLLRHTSALTNYDFESSVDVNILGHIFEHSLNEIESTTAELEGVDFDKQKSKRKKDGVFYTPKYITKYIVDNTVGKLCEEKKAELGIREDEFTPSRQKETKRKLLVSLEKYRSWLLKFTICDPACGSGAFLNQALEFLISEHHYIDDLNARLFGSTMVFQDVENQILENNIFGVDINEESVDIARLSLWLRTAQRGRKLTTLNKNIKCGNSLIDDPEVAGDKAFNWSKEFPEVFAKGGFDVVIGNPPYIKEATNKSAFNGLREHYCYQGKMDLWYFFGALAIDIIKKDCGLIGYIAPNNWITNDGAAKFRNYVVEKGKILKFIDFSDFKVFDSAGIQTMIYIMKRTKSNQKYNLEFSKVLNSKIKHENTQLFLEKLIDPKYEYFQSEIIKDELVNKPINFINSEFIQIIESIKSKENFQLESKEIASGIDLLQDFVNKKHKQIIDDVEIGDGIFNLSQEEYNNLNLTEDEKGLVKPFYTTNELRRYYGNRKNKYWIIYTNSGFKDEERIKPFPNIKGHLDKFLDVFTSVNKPYGLHRSRDEQYFTGEKIFSLRKCSDRPRFSYTDFDAYVNRTFMVIKTNRLNQKYLTGLLNSSLTAFWLKYKGKMQGNNYQIDKNPLLNLPLIEPTQEIQVQIADLVTTIIGNSLKQIDYNKLFEKAKSDNNFDREIQLEKELEQIAINIDVADKEIDRMVYELYGMTEEEIRIVEESTK